MANADSGGSTLVDIAFLVLGDEIGTGTIISSVGAGRINGTSRTKVINVVGDGLVVRIFQFAAVK